MAEDLKFIGDIFHAVVFDGFPSRLKDLMGEGGAVALLREGVAAGIRRAAERGVIPNETTKGDDIQSKFEFCYSLMNNAGFEFEREVVTNTPDLFTEKVTICPHAEFTRREPIACNSCLGMKIGIFEAAFGKVPRIDVKKKIATGDEFCLFEVYPKEEFEGLG